MKQAFPPIDPGAPSEGQSRRLSTFSECRSIRSGDSTYLTKRGALLLVLTHDATEVGKVHPCDAGHVQTGHRSWTAPWLWLLGKRLPSQNSRPTRIVLLDSSPTVPGPLFYC